MKKLNIIKFVLDTIMVVTFVLLFNYKVMGMLFHEVVGLAIGAVILLHCGLNWNWIKGITSRIFKSKLPTKTRIGYFLNILLLLNVIIIIISGVLISKKLLPGFSSSGGKSLQVVHISLSYFCLLLIGIHIGIHWNWVMVTFKRIFKITEKKKIYSYISKLLMILILTYGIYSTYSVKFLSKLSISPLFSSSTSIGNGGNGIKKGDFKPTYGAEGSTQESRETMEGANGSPQENRKAKGEGLGNSSILLMIASNLGVISLFSIITFYIEKLFTKRKKVVS